MQGEEGTLNLPSSDLLELFQSCTWIEWSDCNYDEPHDALHCCALRRLDEREKLGLWGAGC